MDAGTVILLVEVIRWLREKSRAEFASTNLAGQQRHGGRARFVGSVLEKGGARRGYGLLLPKDK